DGTHSIEQMAMAARDYGYEYLGITDHSQSLKIARGVSVEDLWEQIRFIDKLNGHLNGIRVLKSAEVDIHADGTSIIRMIFCGNSTTPFARFIHASLWKEPSRQNAFFARWITATSKFWGTRQVVCC